MSSTSRQWISVPESMQNPVECNELNTTGTLMVLEAAAQAGVKKLIFSSSAAIYGDNPVIPKLETMVPEPRSPMPSPNWTVNTTARCSSPKATADRLPALFQRLWPAPESPEPVCGGGSHIHPPCAPAPAHHHLRHRRTNTRFYLREGHRGSQCVLRHAIPGYGRIQRGQRPQHQH